MKSKIFIFTASLLFSGIITSCKQTATGVDKENDIEFDSITVNERYYLLGDSTNPFCTLESQFIYPSGYKDKDILNKLNRHFIHSFFGEDNISFIPKEAMEKYVRRYITNYMELENDFIEETKILGEKPHQESWFAYYETSSNEILYNRYDLLSYIVSVDYYTGGAHGEQGFNNFVIDLKTGEELAEKDIFVENYQDELSKIIVEAIASDNNVTDPAELESMGFFNVEEIYPNNNFYVDENGITYTFNKYEIAAYFVGKIDVTLPFDRISHLMLENSPVAPLVFTVK
ncbi:MAG: DUF3298 and DUF4163 domain-containing protein [Tannerella sp.]|jgi:hypothetical protein|nr:DUF3298 and DUF4163 domain-containing protein [Tannerella sp.]